MPPPVAGDLDDRFKEAVQTKQLIKEDLLGGWAVGMVNGPPPPPHPPTHPVGLTAPSGSVGLPP
jgi:hypothetical protein